MNEWARKGVVVSLAAKAAMADHAVASYGAGLPCEGGFEGEEACGVLRGPKADPLRADIAVRLENRANKYHQIDPESFPRTGRTYFRPDGKAFERLIAEGAASDQPVKVLYHSHLDCGAYFSEEDAVSTLSGCEAPPYELVYIVVSVRGDGRGGGARVDDFKAFVWVPESCSFEPARLDFE